MNSGGGFFTGRWQSCNNSDIGVGFPTAGGSCESNSSNITTNAASWGDPGGGGASLWSSAAAAAPTPSHGGGGGAIPPFLYDGAPPEAGLFSQLFGDAAHQSPQNHHLHRSPSVYCASGGGGEGEGGGCGPHQLYLDPHLTCLRLGKGHYFEEAAAAAAAAAAAGASGSGGGTTIAHPPDVAGWCHVAEGFSVGLKRGRSPPAAAGCFFDSAAAAAVPRCQVDGCHVALVNAKDYHRRHKVCEMHAKAPRVEVLGVDKRFCQQCSRFHAVTEFDDAKRSCRRRLAGHNERRRKGSQDSCPKNPSQDNFSQQTRN